VGTLKEPDFEAVNAIQPDLIIISGRQQDSYNNFKKLRQLFSWESIIKNIWSHSKET